MIRSTIVTLLTVAVLGCMAGCRKLPPEESTTTPAPASVEGMRPEADLSTIRLTQDAEQRLGIETVAAQRRDMAGMRSFGGEVILPPGSSITVSSPFPGSVSLAADTASLPATGTAVHRGDAILGLLPLLSPERWVLAPADRVTMEKARADFAMAKIGAQGEVDVATARVDAARVTLDRAERLVRDEVGSLRALDDAKAELTMAEASRAAAQERVRQLTAFELDAEPGEPSPILMHSPLGGLLGAVHVRPEQIVAAGESLFDVLDLTIVWVKVAVYAGEIGWIDTSAPARVASLGPKRTGDDERDASPVATAPSADPTAATIDLFYGLENGVRGGGIDAASGIGAASDIGATGGGTGIFRPGQRVQVTLRLTGLERGIAVPTSAILYDIHGQTWVYVKSAPLSYLRRRVEYLRSDGATAVLTRGLEDGEEVVSVGAPELFGTEFGVGH